jgi:pimeloyl-ACP methyl ester carboxylesterase
MTPSPRELTLDAGDFQLAARAWGPPDAPKVLALHGWLDNAATFDRLAPLLPGLHLVAIDLPGHGRSDHRPPGASGHFVDWVVDVVAIVDHLGWTRCALLGHSMGAGIASLVPAILGERVERMVLIEGLGPLSSPPEHTPEQLAEAIAAERRAVAKKPRSFPDLEAAVRARMRGSDLDQNAARVLVERAIEVTAQGVRFRHDPRLTTPSRVRLTEPQVHAFLAATSCPVLLIRARAGWPVPDEAVAARLGAIPDAHAVEVEGGHHVHLTHPDRVAPLIHGFLTDEMTRPGV